MNAPFTRRGACPALEVPMQTGDGLLARLRPVAEGLKPETLAALCEAAARRGNGLVEITARGSFQARGLTPESAVGFAADVAALGIAVAAGMPVQISALAGLDPDETADPRPLATAIRAGAGERGLLSGLGPKVSVVVEGGGCSGLAEVAADIRLTTTDDGRWQMALAGDAKTARPVAVLSDAEAPEATLSALAAIAALGETARAKDVVTEIANRLGQCPMGGGGNGRSPLPGLSIALRDSRIALPLALPFGQVGASSLAAFVRDAADLGVCEFRFASPRLLLALCAGTAAMDPVRRRGAGIGLIVEPADARLHIAACPGAPACASGHIAAREIAGAIATRHPGLFDGSFRLHVSGCTKGCAHPAETALNLVGTTDGIGLVLDGTARAVPDATASVPLSAFARLAARLDAGRGPGESMAACMARLGAERLAHAFREPAA